MNEKERGYVAVLSEWTSLFDHGRECRVEDDGLNDSHGAKWSSRHH